MTNVSSSVWVQARQQERDVAAAQIAQARTEGAADAMRRQEMEFYHPGLARVATGDAERDKALSFLAYILCPDWLLGVRAVDLETCLFRQCQEAGQVRTPL